MLAVLCDSNYVGLCGSDGCVYVDGRLSLANRIRVVEEYRNRFKPHFEHKYKSWTHCYFTSSPNGPVGQLHKLR